MIISYRPTVKGWILFFFVFGIFRYLLYWWPCLHPNGSQALPTFLPAYRVLRLRMHVIFSDEDTFFISDLSINTTTVESRDQRHPMKTMNIVAAARSVTPYMILYQERGKSLYHLDVCRATKYRKIPNIKKL